MLAVINRYKVFFIIIAFIVLAALVWLLFSMQSNSKVPSKGVFVLNHFEERMQKEGGEYLVAAGIYKG